MPHTLPPSWRDLLRRLPILTAAGLLLAVAAAPASAADKSADKSRGKATQAATSQSGTASGTGSGTEGKGTGGQADTPLPPPPPTTGPSNPMVASVEGHPIYLSDIGRAEKALPANLRGMPFDSVSPVLLDRLVDHQALVMLALRRDLEDNPEVKQQIQDVTDRVLEAALLAQDAVPKVTEAATKARYDAIYANRPATEQVRARHILVGTEAEAKKVIAELNAGADFATLAAKDSLDPDGKKGGDLGFFSREQVWPGFADVAFSLQPGQVADQPIHNEFGWHVVKVEERRLVAPPSYSDMRERIRNELMTEAIAKEVATARGQLTIHEWNLDGSEVNPALRIDNVTARAKQ